MKKIFALILTVLLVFGSFGVIFATALTADNSGAQQTNAATNQGNVYLVPGTYTSGGAKVENTIANGARKLSEEECDEIFTENAYLCTLSEGETLPLPTSERVDKEGNPYTFNGWWSIVDATVTYFDKVPATEENLFLYADWRADLSQRKDPVAPPEVPVVEPNHYLEITRKATGETEKLTLRVSGTDMSNAEQLGYGQAVQLYIDGFELNPGDTIKVYTTGLESGEDAKIAPIIINNYREINLESAGDGSNRTENYLSATCTTSKRQNPYLTCIAETTRNYRIYIKFYSGGSTMAVYMEPKA